MAHSASASQGDANHDVGTNPTIPFTLPQSREPSSDETKFPSRALHQRPGLEDGKRAHIPYAVGDDASDLMSRAELMSIVSEQNQKIMALFRNHGLANDSKHDLYEDMEEEHDPFYSGPRLGDDTLGESEGYGTSVSVLPASALQIFRGDEESREDASAWLQRFEHTAVTCRWPKGDIIERFQLSTGKPVQDWFAQLRPDTKKCWRMLRARFVKHYIMQSSSKAELYYSMKQRPTESIMLYLFRFNAAARRMGIDIHSNKRSFNDHVQLFAKTVGDKELGERLSYVNFNTTDDLEAYLDRYRINLETQAFARSNREVPKPSVTMKPKAGGKKAFFLDNWEETPTEVEVDPLVAEIFLVGRDMKRGLCGECNKEHVLSDGECWANAYCVVCRRKGHPSQKCFRACPLCKAKPHHQDEACPIMVQLVEVKLFLDGLGDVEGKPDLSCLKV